MLLLRLPSLDSVCGRGHGIGNIWQRGRWAPAQTTAAGVLWLMMVIQVHVRVFRVSGRLHIANKRVEHGWRAALINCDVQQTTTALQESWCSLHHGLLAHVRESCVSRRPHVAERVQLWHLFWCQLFPIAWRTLVHVWICGGQWESLKTRLWSHMNDTKFHTNKIKPILLQCVPSSENEMESTKTNLRKYKIKSQLLK